MLYSCRGSLTITIVLILCLEQLVANAEQKSQQKVLVQKVGKERDKKIREFNTNNCLDGLQLKLGKLFGDHVDAYVFGNGVWAFPAYMRKKHEHVKLYKMKRMVGNRALVFHENALVHYIMIPYYLSWCVYVRRKKQGNMLHVRVEAMLRCTEEVSHRD